MTTQPARSDADSNEKNTRVLRVLSVMERVAAASRSLCRSWRSVWVFPRRH